MSDVPSRTPPEPEDQPRGENRASEVRSPVAVYVWVFVIAALGAVWWWFGRSEPVVPTSAPPLLQPGARATPQQALGASSGWAEILQRREMVDIAERRTQAARQAMRRQTLGAPAARLPEGTQLRLRPSIPSQTANDASAP